MQETENLNQTKQTIDDITHTADKMSQSLTKAFSSALTGAKSFDQSLQGVILSLGKMVLSAGMNQLGQGLSSLVSGAFGGGSGDASAVSMFAEGGIVSRPTFFGSGGGLGLMGERGAEAIMPLARGPDGRLGLAMSGGGEGGGGGPVNVYISTPDTEGFKRSQVHVASTLAAAVARGQRNL